MSLNNANTHISSNANIGMNSNNYPFLESPGPVNNLGAGPRSAPSPMAPQPPIQVNGNGNGTGINGVNVGMPMNAGQQMDVNMLYQKVMELSEVLKENREKTQGIVAGAEELAVSPRVFWGGGGGGGGRGGFGLRLSASIFLSRLGSMEKN